MFKLVYYRAHVSAANVALLSCMYVLLCKFILVTVQINIHSLIHSVVHASFNYWTVSTGCRVISRHLYQSTTIQPTVLMSTGP